MQSHNPPPKYNATRLCIGIVVILSQIFRDDFGFTAIGSAEAMGYNLFALLMYALGVWLLYSGLRPKRRPATPQSPNP